MAAAAQEVSQEYKLFNVLVAMLLLKAAVTRIMDSIQKQNSIMMSHFRNPELTKHKCDQLIDLVKGMILKCSRDDLVTIKDIEGLVKNCLENIKDFPNYTAGKTEKDLDEFFRKCLQLQSFFLFLNLDLNTTLKSKRLTYVLKGIYYYIQGIDLVKDNLVKELLWLRDNQFVGLAEDGAKQSITSSVPASLILREAPCSSFEEYVALSLDQEQLGFAIENNILAGSALSTAASLSVFARGLAPNSYDGVSAALPPVQ